MTIKIGSTGSKPLFFSIQMRGEDSGGAPIAGIGPRSGLPRKQKRDMYSKRDTAQHLDSGSTATLRHPRVEDGLKIWSLVKAVEKLDLNSAYCYLVLCSHFADTCVVAEEAGDLVGFLTAYRPPAAVNVLFVWQIGVAGLFQRKGLGLAMLTELLRRDSCRGVSYLETTITQSNPASKALFASLQKRLKAPCVESLLYSSDLFPDGNHAEERLHRIGPFDLSQFKQGVT